MPVCGRVAPPPGWREYVRRAPQAFAERPLHEFQVMNRQRRNELYLVQREVNHVVHYASDQVLHGKRDLWRLPKWIAGRWQGDCEDIALEKRRRLVETFGWPEAVLRLTLCLLPIGGRLEAHIVLGADVYDRGGHTTLILDNRHAGVRDWRQYGYALRNARYESYESLVGRWLSREVPGCWWWEKIERKDEGKPL